MTEAIGSGTGAGLLAFLDWTIEKNELNKATASALKTGVRNVLSVEDDPDFVDLRGLDMDNFLNRFTNKTRGQFKDKSQEVYRQRFRQSVGMYLAWLDGSEWRPARLRPNSGGNSTSNGTSARRSSQRSLATANGNRSDQGLERTDASQPAAPGSPPSGLIEYPFPLRPGLRARLMLPEDLNQSEAERVSAFIRALAFEAATD